jgi:hypothetical protein
VTVLSARTSIAARVYHRSGGAGPGHDHDPDPAPRKADELDRRAQPAPSHRTHPPAVDVHPGADLPTTPRLPELGSQRPTARQRDARSRLARGPDQRWPQDQAPDEAWPSLKWHSTAAQPSTRTRVRRPVRRHDHLEEVEFQPAAPRGLPASASMSAPVTLARRRNPSVLAVGRRAIAIAWEHARTQPLAETAPCASKP